MKKHGARRRARATRTLLLTATSTLAFVAMFGPFGLVARASSGDEGPAHGLAPFVLLSIALMLLVAKLGGELFVKAGQPAVLGELVGGILLGSLSLFGVAWVERLRADEVVAALAEIGVIILLFEVGLESNLGEMKAVGWSSLLVATLGVVAPFFLGWGVAAYFLPAEPTLGHVFIGATLCATSVGITARVLRDTGRLQTREASIILGAAVVDDVMGLLILAVVAGAIRAAGEGGALALADVGWIALKSIAFLVGAILVGQYVVPHLFRGAARMQSRGVLVSFAVAFCFLLAWAAGIVGLAPIVGAFAAGLVLDEIHFESFVARGEQRVSELLAPVSAILVPVFFVLMGLKVDLRAFARVEILGFAAVLTFVAILGKQVCSLGVVGRGVNRLAVGLGMIPRGEVGLIFAGIGATLWLPGAGGARVPVIDAATFGAVVIMVLVTTLVTPPALKWAMKRKDEGGRMKDEVKAVEL
jgi:Kef-type K+ transport system membrane component KefB